MASDSLDNPNFWRHTGGGLRAVLLDLDGTLVDTVGDFEVALNQMLRDLELPAISAAEIRRIIGKGSAHLIQTVLERKLAEAGRAHDGAAVQALFQRAWDAYMRGYLRINGQHATVYDGVREGLQQLHDAGLPLAVVTNKPLALAEPLLHAKALDGGVRFVVGGDSFARKKPDPYPLLRACERLRASPAETLMIGDSSNDAKAARAAGCAVALLRYGYNHGEPIERVDADGYFDSIAGIAAALGAAGRP